VLEDAEVQHRASSSVRIALEHYGRIRGLHAQGAVRRLLVVIFAARRYLPPPLKRFKTRLLLVIPREAAHAHTALKECAGMQRS
jgi:hypothetical protein